MGWRRLAIAGAIVAFGFSSSFTRRAASQGSGASETARAGLAEAIERAITLRRGALGGARIGIAAVDLTTGEYLFERDADEGFNTASNTKIVTTAAALALLGPEYRLRTEVLAEELDDAGTVTGDLYLRGRGNPGFGSDSMQELCRAVVDAGVKKIAGGIAIDASYFDGVDLPPHFDEQPDEHASFRAPIGATSLNFNMFTVTVQPAPRGTGAARVSIDPANDYIALTHTVSTVARGRTRLRIDSVEEKGTLKLVVSGQIRRDASPRRFRRRAPDPVAFAGTALRRALVAHGISVGKKRVVTATAPETARLIALHESPPLAVLVRGLGKYSNNYVAEMLLKVIGAEIVADGTPASWSHATGAVERFLIDIVGLAPGSFRYGNGSGLFESNQFTPRQMTRVLAHAARDFRWGPDLLGSLSIAGADGTLSRRLEDGPAERRIRAKTGTLAQVSALSGFAAIDGRRPIAFSVLVNDIPLWKTGDARALQDAVAEALIQYLRAPD